MDPKQEQRPKEPRTLTASAAPIRPEDVERLAKAPALDRTIARLRARRAG